MALTAADLFEEAFATSPNVQHGTGPFGLDTTIMIAHPVCAVKVVDTSGNVNYVEVHGTIQRNGDGTNYKEHITIMGHDIYNFHSDITPDIGERFLVWDALTLSREYGTARSLTSIERFKALNPTQAFGFEDCVVCYEKTTTRTICKHVVCMPCQSQLKQCPLRCGPMVVGPVFVD
jgi:hypothetical protein